MSEQQHRGRLFRKYLIVFLTLVGGVLITSSLVELYFSYQETKRALVRVEREQALAAAERIERFITDIERQVRATTHAASDDPAAAPAGSRSQTYRQSFAEALAEQRELDFLRLIRNVPAITELRHLDFAGKEQIRVSRLALDAMASGEDLSQSPGFVGAKGGATFFSPVYFRDESEPYMTIALPSGQYVVEVTVAEVRLKSIWDVVSRIAVGRNGYAYVVDSRGQLVAHPDISMVLQKRDLSTLPQVQAARQKEPAAPHEARAMVAKGLDGGRVLAAHAAIGSLGWFVLIEQPLAEAFAPLQDTIIRSMLILALGLLASLLASVFLARGMVAPIRRLQLGAEKIGAGDLGHRIDVKTGDEVEGLAEEFNRTAAKLQELYTGLEQKVDARTRELGAANAELRALGEVGRAVASTLDLDTVLRRIVSAAVELTGADQGTIYDYDEGAKQFLPRVTHGMEDEHIALLRSTPVRFGEGAVGHAAASGRSWEVPDVLVGDTYEDRLREFAVRSGFRAVLAVPMSRDEHILGGLVVRRKAPGAFGEERVRLLEGFAAQSTLALQNARLFAEIESKSRELESASTHKSQFLANMSHELRTPMNAIIGVSEMLLEDARDLKRQDEIEPLERILRAAQHLLALINDILDLSKIEAGKMDLNLEEFAIAPLVEDIAATVRPMAEKNGNRVNVECASDLGAMHADPTRVRQALLNLASNAVKFTEKGTVTISAARESVEGSDTIALYVRDDGIGMTAEQTARLFQDFTQADASTTRKYGGTGLGLAISRRFCRMMGGDITVESAIGHGSTFTINLPAAVAEGAEELTREGVPDAPAPRGVRRGQAPVLVIDDDQTVRQLMERHLTREGFAVVTAENGIIGLSRAREIHPCAITLDVMMPDIDGWTVLAALKGDPSLADIPVVLVTIVDEKQRGYTLGATEYLVKPVDRERLASTLRALCGRTVGHLLLIEDDDTARSVVRQSAERDGWTVTEATNGRIGLECLASQRPDAIVLDLMMPEMDGFEFVAELREHPEWSAIPVVVITALDLSEEDHRRLNGDVERVIQKSSHTPERLLHEVSATLAAYMRRHEALDTEHAQS